MDKIKYVTLEITTHIYQEDLYNLIEHLKKLDDFRFLIKCELYSDEAFERKKNSDMTRLLSDKMYPNSYTKLSEEIANR